MTARALPFQSSDASARASLFGEPLKRIFWAVFFPLALLPGHAYGYRPFDGTDAAVAAPGELEIELQPVGWKRDTDDQKLVAPAAVVNLGLAKNWEAVIQGQLETPLSSPGAPELTNAGAFLKHVLREGSLQDKSGPSIATEFGVLLPGADRALGASWAAIISQRWDWGTVHFNFETSLARDQSEVFVSTILEGPKKWKVRPVAEIFFEDKFGKERTASAMAGLIWQAREHLAFDLAIRAAETNGRPVEEIRAGVTFGFQLWRGSK